MTLNGQNAPLAEIKKNFGAHHKNFNEDRLMLSAAKCRPRPMDVFLLRDASAERGYEIAFVCNDQVPYSHRLELFENNFTAK